MSATITQAMPSEPVATSCHQKLFDHMSVNYGLILAESEMDDIEAIVRGAPGSESDEEIAFQCAKNIAERTMFPEDWQKFWTSKMSEIILDAIKKAKWHETEICWCEPNKTVKGCPTHGWL